MVLVIGTLAAAPVSLAQAGDKAAFNAPLRDAMPDITPIIVKAPEAPVDVTAAVAPALETRSQKSKHAARVARTKAQKHDAVARTELDRSGRESRSGSAHDIVDQAHRGFLPRPGRATRVQIRRNGIGQHAFRPTRQPRSRRRPMPSPTVAPAGAKTEAASRTPGPPPAANPDGPREHGSETMADLVAKHAAANGVPVKLAQAVVRIESRGNVHASNAGALGLMQIKFGTARAAGFSGPAVGLFVADTNLRFGMKILGDAYRAAGGDTCGALMRYQSGHYATHMSRANVLYCSRARAIMAGA